MTNETLLAPQSRFSWVETMESQVSVSGMVGQVYKAVTEAHRSLIIWADPVLSLLVYTTSRIWEVQR